MSGGAFWDEGRERDRGTPQGGVISPLLANLFLHYVFDVWLKRACPGVPFERYADDTICHCRTEHEALTLRQVLDRRFTECGLLLHPEKTKVVYCKDTNRRGDLRREVAARPQSEKGTRPGYALLQAAAERTPNRMRGAGH